MLSGTLRKENSFTTTTMQEASENTQRKTSFEHAASNINLLIVLLNTESSLLHHPHPQIISTHPLPPTLYPTYSLFYLSATSHCCSLCHFSPPLTNGQGNSQSCSQVTIHKINYCSFLDEEFPRCKMVQSDPIARFSRCERGMKIAMAGKTIDVTDKQVFVHLLPLQKILQIGC